MPTRPKTGGRQKGTPNKRTQNVIDKLAALKCDPIEAMARIAKDAEKAGDLNVASQMYKELAQYIAPKRKAIEMTAEVETTKRVISSEIPTETEWAEKYGSNLAPTAGTTESPN